MLANVLSITSLLSGVVTSFAETEREMISIERAQEYVTSKELQPYFEQGDEAMFDDVSTRSQPPFGWPHLGWLKFVNVTLRWDPRQQIEESDAENHIVDDCIADERGHCGKTYF